MSRSKSITHAHAVFYTFNRLKFQWRCQRFDSSSCLLTFKGSGSNVMTEFLTIGQVAQRLGISSKTIRYYERIGLLPEMDRADNGYRRLNTQDVNRLRFIRRAKTLGLKLEEIRALTSAAEDGECKRITAELKEIVDSKIQECTRQIESLSALRISLEQVSLRINTSDHENDEHAHHHDHDHATAHPPFSPRCTCLPDALDLSLLGEGIR